MRYRTAEAKCARCGWTFSSIGRNSAQAQLAQHDEWCKTESAVMREVRRCLFDMTRGQAVIPERVTPCRSIAGVFHVTAGSKKYLFFRDTRELVSEDDILRSHLITWS